MINGSPTVDVIVNVGNPTTWSLGSTLPIAELNDTPVNPINWSGTSTIVPCWEGIAIPVIGTTTDPVPSTKPTADVIDNPVGATASFGTTTDPCCDVTVNVGKRISTALTAVAVPCCDVIDKPVTDTSSLGATAVPCVDVICWLDSPTVWSLGSITPIAAVADRPVILTGASITGSAYPWRSLITKPFGSTVTPITFEIVPRVELNDWPEGVTVTLIVLVIDPTFDVIDKPVGWATASESWPHSSSPQDFAPQPWVKTVASFQPACPQVSRPHPEETSGTVTLLC